MYKACGGVPLTLGLRALAWPPRWPMKLCGGGFRVLASGPSACCDVGFRDSLTNCCGGLDAAFLFMGSGCLDGMTCGNFLGVFSGSTWRLLG